MGGCASTEEQSAHVLTDDLIPKSTQQIEDVMASVDARATDGEPAVKEDEPEDEIEETLAVGIPHELNDEVQAWIEYFTVKDRERFQRFLERGESYRPMVQAVLREQGMPANIYYLAMIESGFVTHATSRASAVGIWQFIRATGRRYGLRIDRYVDERRDPMRATIAAALYLRDLHNVFNSWYLAMAAYNSGEMRVLQSIMKHKTRDFWELVRKDGLPRETMNYIPKFLAASIIGHNPEKYGFDDIEGEARPLLKPVQVPSPVQMHRIAKVSGVPLDVLKKYNPQIRRGMTPPGVKTYKIWVPKDYVDLVAGKTDELAKYRVRNVASTGSVTYHRVRRGESLSSIARKYRTSISNLKRLNGLRSSTIYAGQRLKLSGTAYTRYRVRRGDSLGKIAERFGTSVSTLKRINRLKRNTIYAGQLLKVGTKNI